MYILLVDSAKRFKAWRNGSFVYTPYADDFSIIKITHIAEFLFGWRAGDGVLPINDDGSVFVGNIDDFLKKMRFGESPEETLI